MITPKNIVEQIYANPALFHCADFNEEHTRLFIENLKCAIPQMVENFRPERCSFTSYMIALVRLYAKTWRKSQIENKPARHYRCKTNFSPRTANHEVLAPALH
ncbi:MAG: hypothetical protein Ta2A_01160 [Treponemataceae bacterium]|nr:MAG: hypothetical protein Ta2A_01160 [Treponemataceae bacterium]